MTSQRTDASQEPVDPGDAHKTIVRLVVGGIGEGIDRLMTLSRALDEADSDPDSTQISPIHADPTLMAMVGWISELPRQARQIANSASKMTYPITRAAGVAWDTGAFVAKTTGIAGFVEGLTEPLLTAIAEERERLTSVGTGEYARGRLLAVQVFEQSVDGIMGYLGTSEELGELVREQTLGITGSAVREIRETGAAADGLTEGVFRRLLGREKRGIPPMPVPRTE
ncbi:MAG: hypothetical protein M5U23_12000 [Acidimicrobiia bacterium]|nr:hypothetical protein [Acidimicrobiia bacterium]